MSLRIAFNATPLLRPMTGIGNYLFELSRSLVANRDVDAHSFYGSHWRHEAPMPLQPDVRSAAVRSLRGLMKPLVPLARGLRDAQHRLVFGHGLRRRAIDVYHEPNFVPLCYDVPVVTSIHDLSWLRYPDAQPADRVRWLEKGVPRALERSAAILVDSEFVRQEVLSTFGVAPERVTVAHLGVDRRFHPRTAEETASVLVPAGLVHGSYVLTVGTIEPRKNLAHTLDAYALLPIALRERFPLVVAGARGWLSAEVEARLRQFRGRGQVRFFGHVAAAHLPSIYAGAAVFVFPSLYEGFGLPPLEAMASGVPILVSNRSALPELAGDAGMLLDPDCVEQTAESLVALLNAGEVRRRLSQAGLGRARRFTWTACARATLVAFRGAAGAQGA